MYSTRFFPFAFYLTWIRKLCGHVYEKLNCLIFECKIFLSAAMHTQQNSLNNVITKKRGKTMICIFWRRKKWPSWVRALKESCVERNNFKQIIFYRIEKAVAAWINLVCKCFMQSSWDDGGHGKANFMAVKKKLVWLKSEKKRYWKLNHLYFLCGWEWNGTNCSGRHRSLCRFCVRAKRKSVAGNAYIGLI